MVANKKKSPSKNGKRGAPSGRSFIRPEERPDLTTPVPKKSGK
jgi:hypothetical protein